jgi:hypothetical protein
MAMDAACAHYFGPSCTYDANGKHAAAGVVCGPILDHLLQDAFYTQPAPKSTGRERFGEAFMDAFYARAEAEALAPEDALATLTELTALTVAGAVRPLWDGPLDVLVGGGGVHNAHLLARLRHHLPLADVRTYSGAKRARAGGRLALRRPRASSPLAVLSRDRHRCGRARSSGVCPLGLRPPHGPAQQPAASHRSPEPRAAGQALPPAGPGAPGQFPPGVA